MALRSSLRNKISGSKKDAQQFGFQYIVSNFRVILEERDVHLDTFIVSSKGSMWQAGSSVTRCVHSHPTVLSKGLWLKREPRIIKDAVRELHASPCPLIPAYGAWKK